MWGVILGSRKLTLEEVKTRLKDINPNIEILSNEYINNSTKMLCKCLIDGNEWYVHWGNLNSGKGCPKCGIKSSADKKRGGIDDIIEILDKSNKNIRILSTDYKNRNTKIDCECLDCSNVWKTTAGSLCVGSGCPQCAANERGLNKRLRIEDIKLQLSEANPNIIIEDDIYIDAHSKLNCRCLVDGYKWKSNWNKLQQGGGCPKCGIVSSKEKQKYSIEYITSKLSQISPTIKIISESYTNNKGKIDCECLVCGHNFKTNWGSLSQGTGCIKCGLKRAADSQRLTIQEIRDRMFCINKNIKILSEQYYNTNSRLQCECLIDGHIWYPLVNNLLSGYGCPKCNNGFYSVKRAEKHKTEWVKIHSFIYLIKCYGNDELFYKIGITQKGVGVRFRIKKFMPYDYDVILEIKTNKYNAIYLESLLHALNDRFSYTPKIKFDGYTECFSQLHEKTFKLMVDSGDL